SGVVDVITRDDHGVLRLWWCKPSWSSWVEVTTVGQWALANIVKERARAELAEARLAAMLPRAQ
ncbi:hypothetical protein ACXWPT_09430, partial [Streptococcus pyogenes]